MVQSAVESDAAGVIFAQKVVELTREDNDLIRARGGQVDPMSMQRAAADLHAAELMLKLSQDRMEVVRDTEAWKSFAKTPIMSKVGHESQP